MRTIFSTRGLILSTLLGLGLSAGPTAVKAGSCQDDDCPVVITTYKTVTVSDVRHVTRYDHCGRPYGAKVVVYRDVRVPVKKVVNVSY